ncbi:MAG: phosphoribosylformylglycinamidine synthase subunit PurS [Actinomycetota bacterium]
MNFRVSVNVMPKAGISDPQGQAVEKALPAIGFKGITGVRIGKRITFLIDASDANEALDVVRQACEKFLANPIIEDFEVEVVP